MDNAWKLLENELGAGPYRLGSNYSVVDPYILMLTHWHENPDALFQRNPKLKRLCETVRDRPAAEKSGHSTMINWKSRIIETRTLIRGNSMLV